MKLLLDENLSDRIISRIADSFPDSTHIKALDLREADDFVVWEWAKKHPTMVDVARTAGVSTATVSHVLSGASVVRQIRRERVLKVIDFLGYSPHPVAASLRVRRSAVIQKVLRVILLDSR